MIRNRVVLVPFPFDDLSASTARPAVCLTESIGPHGHVILAFVTSKIPDDLLFSDIVLRSDSPEFTQTALKGHPPYGCTVFSRSRPTSSKGSSENCRRPLSKWSLSYWDGCFPCDMTMYDHISAGE